jgi:predicted amidohydrolase
MPKIALIQFKASTDKNQNLKLILNYIKKASKHGAELCAFPEFMMFYTSSSQSPSKLASLAETIDGKFVNSIANSAKENRIQVVGTFYEKSKKKNRVYDTSFLINKSGKIVSTYRKVHLYDALGFRESNKMTPGSKIMLPKQTTVGKLGMLICYDLRFPEMARTLVSAGSEILVAPSAWVKGKMKEDHWITINKTRAVENGCYVIAPDQVGNIYCGRSIVVDPFGKILLDMKKREGIGIVNISLGKVKQTRKLLPLLRNRRTDLYSNFRIAT